jgi:hypothetical protein
MSKYSHFAPITGIIGYVVNLHDPLNYDIDLCGLDETLIQRYSTIIQNTYSYKDEEGHSRTGTTYRCRLKGIGIHQPKPVWYDKRTRRGLGPRGSGPRHQGTRVPGPPTDPRDMSSDHGPTKSGQSTNRGSFQPPNNRGTMRRSTHRLPVSTSHPTVVRTLDRPSVPETHPASDSGDLDDLPESEAPLDDPVINGTPHHKSIDPVLTSTSTPTSTSTSIPLIQPTGKSPFIKPFRQHKFNKFKKMDHLIKEAHIAMIRQIDRQGGWVFCTISDCDVYNRILISLYDPITGMDLSSILLSEPYNKVFRPYNYVAPPNDVPVQVPATPPAPPGPGTKRPWAKPWSNDVGRRGGLNPIQSRNRPTFIFPAGDSESFAGDKIE